VESPRADLADAPTVQTISEHPLIKQAMEVLNAKLVSVQPRAKRG
jgi:hypothetical protein